MLVLATDIGGENGKVAVVDTVLNTIVATATPFVMTQNSDTEKGDFETDYRNLLFACSVLIDAVDGPVEAVGLAAAGMLDEARTQLVFAGNLTHWINQPIVERLTHDLGIPVVGGNDAEASALAEAVSGLCSMEEYKGVPFIGGVIGAGMGGCLIEYEQDGSFRTRPMEPGHIKVSNDPMAKCGCGDYGCLEAYVGGNNAVARYGKKTKDPEFGSDNWETYYSWLHRGMKNLLSAHRVPLLVFSGSIAVKQSWLLDRLQEDFDSAQFGHPQFRVSAHGVTAGSLGAASLLSL